MRLYVSPFAPNVARVTILAAERGIALEAVDVAADRAGYLKINSLGQVPSLVLDDGRVVTESLVIAQFLDKLAGPSHLFGDGDDERLAVGMWERRAEMQLFNVGVEYGHHIHPMFAPFMPQFPDYARSLCPKAARAAAVFAEQLDQVPFIAGQRFTAADITACLGLTYLMGYGAIDDREWPSLARWREAILARDSMAEVRQLLAWFGTTSASR